MRAQRVYDWSGRSPLSYHQFRQAQEFEQSIRFSLSSAAGQVVGSVDDVLKARLAVLADRSEQNEALFKIAAQIEDLADSVRAGTDRIVHELNWGFARMDAALSRISGQLGDIHHTLRTPSQTAADEHFKRAQDEVRRQLFPEALVSIGKAIEGGRNSEGVPTDHRYHFLRGLILLGSDDNTDASIVDPAAAEQAFLSSARYARGVSGPAEGLAYLFAARAAFVQKAFERASEYIEITLDRLPEEVSPYEAEEAAALHLDARLDVLLGRPESAASGLFSSFVIAPSSAISADNDDEFASGPGRAAYLQALDEARDEMVGDGLEILQAITTARDKLRRLKIEGREVRGFLDKPSSRRLDDQLSAASAALAKQTIAGAVVAAEHLAKAMSALRDGCLQHAKQGMSAALQGEAAKQKLAAEEFADQQIAKIKLIRGPCVFLGAWIGFIALMIWVFRSVPDSTEQVISTFFLFGAVVGWFALIPAQSLSDPMIDRRRAALRDRCRDIDQTTAATIARLWKHPEDFRPELPPVCRSLERMIGPAARD